MANNNGSFDSSEMLHEEDITLIQSIEELKKHIFSYFKPEGLTHIIKQLIKHSKVLDFINERSEKFLDEKRPTFILKIDRDAAIASYPPERAIQSEEEDVAFLTNVLYGEIIYHFTNTVMQAVKGEPRFKVMFEKEQLSLSQVSVVLSSIFGMRFDLGQAVAHLEYVL